MSYDTLYERNSGNVTITVRSVDDLYADFSDIGTLSDFRYPGNEQAKLVHRDTESVMDHHGIWRDEHGQIVAEPEVSAYRRTYAYTFHDNGHDKIKYAIQDARRLEAMERHEWQYFGVVADVYLDGAAIGRGSVFGVESDSGDAYFKEVTQEVAAEALADAKAWKARNLAA